MALAATPTSYAWIIARELHTSRGERNQVLHGRAKQILERCQRLQRIWSNMRHTSKIPPLECLQGHVVGVVRVEPGTLYVDRQRRLAESLD